MAKPSSPADGRSADGTTPVLDTRTVARALLAVLGVVLLALVAVDGPVSAAHLAGAAAVVALYFLWRIVVGIERIAEALDE